MNFRSAILALTIGALSVTSCADAQPSELAQSKTTVKVVDVEEFFEVLDTDLDAQLVDLRTDAEVADGMISGATQIDWNADGAMEKLKALNKDAPVLLYCASGGRSGRAAKALGSEGFKEIYDLKGGFVAWKAADLPLTEE